MKIRSNAGALAKRIARAAAKLSPALRDGLTKAAIQIDEKQVKNLSGSNSDAPGSYPVPVRTGNLRRSTGWAIAPAAQAAYVFNTAAYAWAIHEGEDAGRSGARINPRPFLDDAAREVDGNKIIDDELAAQVFTP